MAKIIELKNSWNAIILRYFTFDDKISQFFFSLVENWWKRNDLRYLPVYNFNFTRKMTPKKFLKNTWKRSGFAPFYSWQLQFDEKNYEFFVTFFHWASTPFWEYIHTRENVHESQNSTPREKWVHQV